MSVGVSRAPFLLVLGFQRRWSSFPKQFTVRGSQCFKEWSPWCWMIPGRLVSHFLSFVSHFFLLVICLPLLFICLPGWVLVVGFPAGLSPTSFHLFPRLGACGRVPGWLVSHFLSFVSHFFLLVICLPLLFIVSQAGCLRSGSRLACLPLPFICLPLLFISHLSPTSFHLSPRLGACGRVPGWLVSHFLSFVSHFFLLVICLPLLFICLPGWVLVVGFPAGLSPTSFHLSPTSFY